MESIWGGQNGLTASDREDRSLEPPFYLGRDPGPNGFLAWWCNLNLRTLRGPDGAIPNGANAIRIRARIYACHKCRKINAPLGAAVEFRLPPPSCLSPMKSSRQAVVQLKPADSGTSASSRTPAFSPAVGGISRGPPPPIYPKLPQYFTFRSRKRLTVESPVFRLLSNYMVA